MTSFKPYDELSDQAFFSCHVVGCNLEAEKLYGTEISLRDVCLKHHKELTDKDYK
jgi:hypothetical protein